MGNTCCSSPQNQKPKQSDLAYKVESKPESFKTKAHMFEYKIYKKYSNLQIPEDIQIYDVPITFRDNEEYIHTTESGFQNKKILVLIHGYGWNGVCFYKMLPQLSKNFHIYCIDLLGLGLSSHPQFNCKTAQEAIDFFVTGIESWVEALKFKKFILMGHSLGGYISTFYAQRNPDKVEKLYLYGPPGTTEDTETRPLSEQIDDYGFLRKILICQWAKFQKKRFVHRDFKRKYPWLFSLWLRNYVKDMMELEGKEADLIKDFLDQLYGVQDGADACLHLFFKPPRAMPYISIEKVLVELKMDVHVIYGRGDGLMGRGAINIKKKNLKRNYEFTVLKGCDHQIKGGSSEKLAEILIVENREKKGNENKV